MHLRRGGEHVFLYVFLSVAIVYCVNCSVY